MVKKIIFIAIIFLVTIIMTAIIGDLGLFFMFACLFAFIETDREGKRK